MMMPMMMFLLTDEAIPSARQSSKYRRAERLNLSLIGVCLLSHQFRQRILHCGNVHLVEVCGEDSNSRIPEDTDSVEIWSLKETDFWDDDTNWVQLL